MERRTNEKTDTQKNGIKNYNFYFLIHRNDVIYIFDVNWFAFSNTTKSATHVSE